MGFGVVHAIGVTTVTVDITDKNTLGQLGFQFVGLLSDRNVSNAAPLGKVAEDVWMMPVPKPVWTQSKAATGGSRPGYHQVSLQAPCHGW